MYDNPVLGQVWKICVVNRNFNDIIFVLSELNTVNFSSHYQSFEVETMLPGRRLICHHNDLAAFLLLNQVKPYGVATVNKHVVQRFEIGTNN